MKLFSGTKPPNDRIWEIDFLRGIALLLMVYFHIIFDMRDIYGYNVVYDSGWNMIAGKASAILFMLISGVSCSLSRSNIKRGFKVLAAAMVITAATHIFDSRLGIKFGILHLLAAGMLLSPLLMKLDKYLLILVGASIIAAGRLISEINADHDWFFIFGIHSNSFISSDYYPLVPWLGIFILGISAGMFLYKNKKSLFKFSVGQNPVSMAGRHTLPVYMIHQPLILAALELVKILKD